MTAVEGGAALAWRLLATLEGGTIVLATTALLAYTARSRTRRERRRVRSVLVTNTTNRLGRELKTQLESHGCCVVSTLTDGKEHAVAGQESAVAGKESAVAGIESDVAGNKPAGVGKVDALVVVGAESHTAGLDGLAGLITEDVYDNLKLLDSLAPRVRRGGYMCWACAGAASGAFSGAGDAFDAALRASLQHAATRSGCEPMWIGRCESAELAAGRIVEALVFCTTHEITRFSIRNAAHKVSGYVGRWLKIVT